MEKEKQKQDIEKNLKIKIQVKTKMFNLKNVIKEIREIEKEYNVTCILLEVLS